MSTVYVLEPPTKGKVVLTTSYGAIDIELWPKEAPKAVRNFVQLCLEGYYDDTAFHRVIKSFLVQGGDPTGSGQGTVHFGEDSKLDLHYLFLCWSFYLFLCVVSKGNGTDRD